MGTVGREGTQRSNTTTSARLYSLGGEVADDVGQVTAPESGDTLLGGDAREAVHDARVALHLAGANLRVGVLRLDDELNALNRGRHRLRDTVKDKERDCKTRGITQDKKHRRRVTTHAPLIPPARKLIVKSLALLIFYGQKGQETGVPRGSSKKPEP